MFRDRAYGRSLRETIWERFLRWLDSLLHAANARLAEVPWLPRAVAYSIAVILAAVMARAVYLRYARGELFATREPGRANGGRGGPAGDPLLLAQQLAASGDYTGAAHALYQGLLEVIARRERIRLHPSKTAGDYGRDLRQHSSALWSRFRDFARSYEVVVYGLDVCDRERYERLRALAAGILQPNS